MKLDNLKPNHLDHLVPIGRAASILGVSIKTVRRWETQGILQSTRNKLNQRLFDPIKLAKIKQQPITLISLSTRPQYNISQAAKKLSVSVKTIRRWEKLGKIQAFRNQRNQRVFSPEAISQAQSRLEAERFLPTLARTHENYVNTWPVFHKYILVSVAIVIINLIIFRAQSPSLISPQPSQPIESKAYTPPTQLSNTGIRYREFAGISVTLSSESAPPAVTSPAASPYPPTLSSYRSSRLAATPSPSDADIHLMLTQTALRVDSEEYKKDINITNNRLIISSSIPATFSALPAPADLDSFGDIILPSP